MEQLEVDCDMLRSQLRQLLTLPPPPTTFTSPSSENSSSSSSSPSYHLNKNVILNEDGHVDRSTLRISCERKLVQKQRVRKYFCFPIYSILRSTGLLSLALYLCTMSILRSTVNIRELSVYISQFCYLLIRLESDVAGARSWRMFARA